jgi:hypothetical protein
VFQFPVTFYYLIKHPLYTYKADGEGDDYKNNINIDDDSDNNNNNNNNNNNVDWCSNAIR